MSTAPFLTDTHGANSKRSSKMAASQSLNHLLNFTLPPRQTFAPQSLPRRSRKPGTQYGVWNKEKFVNAQYRFVMKPTGDYTVHFADPDIFFQWQDILQVIIPRTSALAAAAGREEHGRVQEEGHTTCPICLSPPSAPRMTKCGHVFCFPCILHYLNTSDNLKWNRCPICFDSVNEKQLKSVKWFDEPAAVDDEADEAAAEASSSTSGADAAFDATPQGSVLRMRLLQRPQITTLALPRSQTWPSDVMPPHRAPFHFLPDVFRYAKFMLATPAYLIADLTRDLDELAAEKQTLLPLNETLGITFVDAAEAKVRNQMAKAAALETYELRDAMAKAEQDLHEIELRSLRNETRRKEASTAAPAQEAADAPEALLATQPVGFGTAVKPSQPSSRSIRPRRNVNPPPPSSSTYYYYQAASGAPIFLHPLDIRILLAHFTSYASFPDTISVRIEARAEGTVNDDLRRRCKYLAHMPEGADVVFVEVDLARVVGGAGLKSFEGALKMRRARRREKGRKDDRARARAEEQERGRLAAPWSPPVALAPAPPARPLSPVELPPQQEAPRLAGAWGERSFASALHSAPPAARPRTQGRTPVSARREDEDEWDVDAAWHELEQRGGGGRRKRSNKLVVLGGAGGRRR